PQADVRARLEEPADAVEHVRVGAQLRLERARHCRGLPADPGLAAGVLRAQQLPCRQRGDGREEDRERRHRDPVPVAPHPAQYRDPPPMISRYTRPELGSIWTDQARMSAWRDVEVAAAEALDGPSAD